MQARKKVKALKKLKDCQKWKHVRHLVTVLTKRNEDI